MVVLIDGYNLLRQIFSKVKGKLDKQREQLIKQLAYYKSKKANDIREIIVVFDGGLLNHATREIRSGIVVVFSGQRQSADEWLLHYIEKHKNEELLLVSLDRELILQAEKHKIPSLGVFDFYRLLQDALQNDVEKIFSKKPASGDLIKYKHDDKYNSDKFEEKIEAKALDLLMEEASLKLPKNEKKNDVEGKKTKLKRKSKTLSKKEKRLYSKIKKL